MHHNANGFRCMLIRPSHSTRCDIFSAKHEPVLAQPLHSYTLPKTLNDTNEGKTTAVIFMWPENITGLGLMLNNVIKNTYEKLNLSKLKKNDHRHIFTRSFLVQKQQLSLKK